MGSYLELTKTIYKELVGVHKLATGALAVRSIVLHVTDLTSTGAPLFHRRRTVPRAPWPRHQLGRSVGGRAPRGGAPCPAVTTRSRARCVLTRATAPQADWHAVFAGWGAACCVF